MRGRSSDAPTRCADRLLLAETLPLSLPGREGSQKKPTARGGILHACVSMFCRSALPASVPGMPIPLSRLWAWHTGAAPADLLFLVWHVPEERRAWPMDQQTTGGTGGRLRPPVSLPTVLNLA